MYDLKVQKHRKMSLPTHLLSSSVGSVATLNPGGMKTTSPHFEAELSCNNFVFLVTFHIIHFIRKQILIQKCLKTNLEKNFTFLFLAFKKKKKKNIKVQRFSPSSSLLHPREQQPVKEDKK